MAADDASARDTAPQQGWAKSPENLAGGALLLLLGAIGFFGTWNVPLGTLAEFGAGMVPRAVAVLVALAGIVLLALGFTTAGSALERWPLRGLGCILGAVTAFGLTLRGFDLGVFRIPAFGLVVAGPLAVTLASLADPQTRLREIALFAVGLTALCVVLFRFILRLPIPIAPWALGY